jgi:hypothetical protein
MTDEPSPKPLFIPLLKKFFDAFEKGTKTEEYRRHGRQWNLQNVYPGRQVTLSSGYTKRRLSGFVEYAYILDETSKIPGWTECYGFTCKASALVIGIRIPRPLSSE